MSSDGDDGGGDGGVETKIGHQRVRAEKRKNV